MRATEFPCIEDILYFIERETVMPNGLWYVDISVQPETSTLSFEGVLKVLPKALRPENCFKFQIGQFSSFTARQRGTQTAVPALTGVRRDRRRLL
jgi:hypothetical protein